jgi:site-specific DNA recombinase
MPTQRCVLYARISVSSDESVSIERQIEKGEQYAAARGWQVVAKYTDDGVSATRNKPGDRAGWRALLDSPESYDAVVIWKIDRLARSTLDFLNAHEALQARGAGIVGIEDPIDMTTPQGELFATILAAFAKAEAASISARVMAARNHLVNAGRVVGGTLPYGWRSVPNPDGPGYVLAQDPERIEFVRGAAEKVLAGGSLYSAVQWLDGVGAPLPGVSQANRKREGWSYSTVGRLLRNPVLAGMTAFNPGNIKKERGVEVLRGADGMPVVDESVAIMSLPEWTRLVKELDDRDSPQSKPRALRSKTSALLSGLLVCGRHVDDEAGTRMHRGTAQGRAGYYCPTCHQTITNFEDVLVEQFLWAKGDHVRWSRLEEVHEGGAATLPDIAQQISELGAQLEATDDDDVADRLTEHLARLRKLRREARATSPEIIVREVRGTQSFGEDWAEATTVEEQRAVLNDAIERVWVLPGRPGRRTPETVLARLVIEWKMPDQVGPRPVYTDAELESWAE